MKLKKELKLVSLIILKLIFSSEIANDNCIKNKIEITTKLTDIKLNNKILNNNKTNIFLIKNKDILCLNITKEEPSTKQEALVIKSIKNRIYKKRLKQYYRSELNAYTKKLSKVESNNEWKIINRYGYMGLFQFGHSALECIGLGNIDSKKFKENPNIFPIELQYIALERHLKINERLLRKYIYKYQGTYINGILITKAGILASAHLVGSENVKHFLITHKDCSDGNNTKLTKYLKMFRNYDLSGI